MKEKPTEPLDTPVISQRQSDFYTLGTELSNLIGQPPQHIARHLFIALTRITEVSNGQLLLIDDLDGSEFCQILLDGQLVGELSPAHPNHDPALARWVYRQRQSVLITDTKTVPKATAWGQFFQQQSARSVLAVPISITSRPLGAIVLLAPAPHHFSSTDLAQITHLANQAAVVIENSRLQTLLTHRQNLISTLQQTTHTVSIGLPLEQTLLGILRQLTEVLNTPYAMVLLKENRTLRRVTTAGFVTDSTSPPVFTSENLPAIFRILDQTQVATTADANLKNELASIGFPDPIRAWHLTPLLSNGQTRGLLILASPTPKTFAEQDHLAIQAIANHIAITIANHHLAQETDRQLRELAFLNETGQAITSTLDLEHILQLLLERVRDLLKINAVSIALQDEQTSELVFEAASGEGAEAVLGMRLNPGQGIAGWVAETGKPLVVPDVYKDARFFPDIDKKIGMRTRAIVCVPIVLKGRVVGVIEALNPGEMPFGQRAIDLLTGLAGMAATAINNARLFARVQNAESRYEGLFDDSINPIIITNMHGAIVDANRNACALLGRSKKALVGTNLSQYLTPRDGQAFDTKHNQIRAGQVAVFETEIAHAGYRTRIEIHGKKLTVQDATLIQWIGRDITAETELTQMREDMVRMIVHDLRNPLANIMNSLDMLEDVIEKKDTSVSLGELVNIARRSGRRMHQLISSILDISRLETGQAILNTRATKLEPLIQEALNFVQPQADIREIRLAAHFAQDLPLVQADQDMLSRVVLNLLDNAIKFTQIGGSVSITASSTGDSVEIAVKDNGPGIPADQLEHIFEKFTRVRRPENPQGTGLGLAFCKLAVQAHGGSIWAESRLGHGTTLRVVLPVESS